MKRSIWIKIVVVMLLVSALLGACASEPQIVEVVVTSPPEIVEVEVVKEVEVTVEVVQLQEVEKEVVVTQIVEVVPDYVPEGTLKIAHTAPHQTWDPHKDQRTTALQYLNPIYEGLLRESNDGQTFIPELATGWEEDDTGVTFELREGITFHDGAPFNADAVVANFNHVKESGHPINKGFLKNVTSAEALDEFTVRYNYSQFDGTVLLTLSRFAGKMMSPASFETVENNMPVGTGPYVYNAEESALDNTFKVYDYYEAYWNDNAQPVARVEITTILDQATLMNGLLAEEFQTVQLSALPLINRAVAAGMQNSIQPSVGWSAHILDRTGEIVPELADERVRQAMSYALDRDQYWQIVNPGFKTTQHALPGGYAFNDEIEDLDFDMEKAISLMEEAGSPQFTIDLPTIGSFNNRNAFLASSWAPLGITVNIVEVGAIFPACTGGEFAVAICPINERHIKHFVENRLLENGNVNPFKHVDEEITALYEQAAELPLDEAEPFYAEIARISAENAYIMHLGWGANPVIFNPNLISGVQVRFFYPGVYYIGDISLKQ